MLCPAAQASCPGLLHSVMRQHGMSCGCTRKLCMGSMLPEATARTGMHVCAPYGTNGTQYATKGSQHRPSAHIRPQCSPLAACYWVEQGRCCCVVQAALPQDISVRGRETKSSAGMCSQLIYHGHTGDPAAATTASGEARQGGSWCNNSFVIQQRPQQVQQQHLLNGCRRV